MGYSCHRLVGPVLHLLLCMLVMNSLIYAFSLTVASALAGQWLHFRGAVVGEDSTPVLWWLVNLASVRHCGLPVTLAQSKGNPDLV